MTESHLPPEFPIRLAEPDEEGLSFRDWLSRRLHRDRRAVERMTVFLLQWGHLLDETPDGISVEEYAKRWRTPVPTVYRLLDEFRGVFPTETDPGRLHDLLWEGLSEPYLPADVLGDLLDVRIVRRDPLDVRIVRNDPPGPRDLREILPEVTAGVLGAPAAFDGGVLDPGTSYEAYEAGNDRFAWAPVPGSEREEGPYVAFLLEREADETWVFAPGRGRIRSSRDDAEMISAAA